MTSRHPSDFDLLEIPELFASASCRDLIAELRHSPATPALTYGQSQTPLVAATIRNVTRLLAAAETVRSVQSRLIKAKAQLEQHFGIGLGDCEEPQFLCYRTGDFFVAHQDGNTGLVRMESDRLRRISISLFLNAQSGEPAEGSFCGGSLVFSDWRSGATRELKAVAGTLVAFRSELTHEVTPVTYGERYSIVTWFAGGTESSPVAS